MSRASDNRRKNPEEANRNRASALRFLSVSVAALAVDYLFVVVLFYGLGLGLTLAAAISVFAVGLSFYSVHEFWTFRRAGSSFSPRRLLGNLLVIAISGGVRTGCVAILASLHTPQSLLVTLYFLIAAGASFTVNFVLNRFIVFRR